jgi:hypothetical protein
MQKNIAAKNELFFFGQSRASKNTVKTREKDAFLKTVNELYH